jgi:hypothetical protein
MTAQALLGYKQQSKRIRYFQGVVTSQQPAPLVIPYQSSRHAHSQRVLVKVIRLGSSLKLSQRLSQANLLTKQKRQVRVAELNARTRMMLRSAGQARHDSEGLGAVELLARIKNPKTAQRDRETAILFAETTAFNDSLRQRLLGGLAKFITKNRFTRSPERITVVGAAVRKYAMNMDQSDFESYANWLQPTQTEPLHHLIELELVKGACWRLSYLPVSGTTKFSLLESTLANIANAYLQSHLILQENYASTALQAILAIAILQALSGERDIIGPIFQRAASLGLNWFSEVLDDRLQETCDAVRERDPQLAERLRQLARTGGDSRAQHAGG